MDYVTQCFICLITQILQELNNWYSLKYIELISAHSVFLRKINVSFNLNWIEQLVLYLLVTFNIIHTLVLQPFLTESHGLRLVASHLAAICLTASWRLLVDEADGTTSSAKSRDEILWSPNVTPSTSWLHLEILSRKITNRIFDKKQSWQSPTPIG